VSCSFILSLKMTRDRILPSLILSILGSLFALSLPAAASVYEGSGTRLVLKEPSSTTENATGYDGVYTARAGGHLWLGRVTLGAINHGVGNQWRYDGTFTDAWRTQSSEGQTCTGNFGVFVSSVGRDNPYKTAAVTWKVTGGSGCPSVGQTFNLTLREALPIADADGNFNNRNAMGWYGGTQNTTWGSWRTVTSSLNCRKTPNGEILKTYGQGQTLKAEADRSGSSFLGANGGGSGTLNGAPWLKTQDKCYVRANSRYITPSFWQDVPID
jgi:hypothetical protein